MKASVIGAMVSWKTDFDACARWFASRVYQIDGVSAVYVQPDERANTIILRTVVSQDEFALRSAVYEVQGKTYDEFPDKEFDFLVLTQVEDRDLGQELVASGFKEVRREERVTRAVG